jgi:hypothetical protein
MSNSHTLSDQTHSLLVKQAEIELLEARIRALESTTEFQLKLIKRLRDKIESLEKLLASAKILPAIAVIVLGFAEPCSANAFTMPTHRPVTEAR